MVLHIHLICFLNYTEFKRILSHDLLSRDKTFNRMQIANRNYFFVFYAQIVQVSHVCHFVIHIKRLSDNMVNSIPEFEVHALKLGATPYFSL